MAIGHRLDYPQKPEQGNGVKKKAAASKQKAGKNTGDAPAVAETSGRAELFLQHTADAIIGITAENEITLFNVAAGGLFMYSSDEVIGESMAVLLHESNWSAYEDFIAQAEEGNQASPLLAANLKMQKKDGTAFRGELSLATVEVDGKIEHLITVRDVTEHYLNRINTQSILQAIDTGWAMVEFSAEGVILRANQNFLDLMEIGSSEEISGRHHKIFCDSEYTESEAYAQFWDDLRSGTIRTDEFKRYTLTGQEVWINATYSPIMDDQGNVHKIVKIANNITEKVSTRTQAEAVKYTVDRALSSAEFLPNGTILSANVNFARALGYDSPEEIIGKHHRIFCTDEYANSTEYAEFWQSLADGADQEGEFLRISKTGEDVWFSATYTPIKDKNDRVTKVIKIASNTTAVKVPVLQVKDIISQVAQGNLTERFDVEAEGYVLEMGEALNDALENLNGLLRNINVVINEVSGSANTTLQQSDSMLKTTQEVASAIQEMAEGAQQQAVQTDEISKLIEEVSRSANDMGEKANGINIAAEEGRQRAKEGMETLRMVVSNMNEIQTSADATSGSIEVLTQRSEEIARTLNVITDIASQTNLLALNAAIEAARAGDAGRGFAVVAEEIRKLAEDSRRSTVDIERVIKEVQKDISGAERSITSMVTSVSSGSEASNKAEVVFKEIESTSADSLSLAKAILEASIVQKGSIETTVKNIEQIVVVTEESASGSEQIATSSKELGYGMSDVQNQAAKLNDMVETLNDQIAKFKLK